jgi:hypothetical protein
LGTVAGRAVALLPGAAALAVLAVGGVVAAPVPVMTWASGTSGDVTVVCAGGCAGGCTGGCAGGCAGVMLVLGGASVKGVVMLLGATEVPVLVLPGRLPPVAGDCAAGSWLAEAVLLLGAAAVAMVVVLEMGLAAAASSGIASGTAGVMSAWSVTSAVSSAASLAAAAGGVPWWEAARSCLIGEKGLAVAEAWGPGGATILVAGSDSIGLRVPTAAAGGPAAAAARLLASWSVSSSCWLVPAPACCCAVSMMLACSAAAAAALPWLCTKVLLCCAGRQAKDAGAEVELGWSWGAVGSAGSGGWYLPGHNETCSM